MSEFKAAVSGESDAQWRQFLSYLFAQSSAGLATPGVLAGLSVTQTTTASASVLVNIGAVVAQTSLTAGAEPLLNNSQKTVDVLTANPLGGVKRNDLIVFDRATSSVSLVVGTPNAVPTDPAVPTGAVSLARLRHDPAVSSTTVPTSQIDDLRVFTSLLGASSPSFVVRGVPMAGASVAKAGKRLHWENVSGTTNSSGVANFAHTAGFTPAWVQTAQTIADPLQPTAYHVRYVAGTATGSQFTAKVFNGNGSARTSAITVAFTALLGE